MKCKGQVLSQEALALGAQMGERRQGPGCLGFSIGSSPQSMSKSPTRDASSNETKQLFTRHARWISRSPQPPYRGSHQLSYILASKSKYYLVGIEPRSEKCASICGIKTINPDKKCCHHLLHPPLLLSPQTNFRTLGAARLLAEDCSTQWHLGDSPRRRRSHRKRTLVAQPNLTLHQLCLREHLFQVPDVVGGSTNTSPQSGRLQVVGLHAGNGGSTDRYLFRYGRLILQR